MLMLVVMLVFVAAPSMRFSISARASSTRLVIRFDGEGGMTGVYHSEVSLPKKTNLLLMMLFYFQAHTQVL